MAKAKEKLWEDCSEEEKAEVKKIEEDIQALKEDYANGLLNKRQRGQRKRRLLSRIDAVEKKYDDEPKRRTLI